MANLQILSPVDGEVIPLQQVPDPAFSEAMLGDGLAVLPTSSTLTAPMGGKVTSLHKALHAVVLKNHGVELLIHIGIESVSLQGQGFQAHVTVGQEVKAGDKLIDFDLALLKEKTPSSAVVLVITAPDGTKIQDAANGSVSCGKDVLFTVPTTQEETDIASHDIEIDQWLKSDPISIFNPNGLHARPAGMLAEESKKYSFPIYIDFNGKTADAKSLVAIMGLSIHKGAQITLRAPQAQEQASIALQTLSSLIQSGLGEDPLGQQPAVMTEENSCPPLSSDDSFKGLVACGGSAYGKTQIFQADNISFEQTAQDPMQEKAALENAFSQLTKELEQTLTDSSHSEKRDILRAHLQILQDPFLLQKSNEQISLGKSAAAAFNDAVRDSIDILKSTKNSFIMERIADFKDLRKRILRILQGDSFVSPNIESGSIVLAEELFPSDLTLLEGKAAGVVISGGSPTAHVSILLRNMGLPALVCAGESILNIPDGTDAILQASSGLFIPNPSEQQVQDYQKAHQEKEKQLKEALEKAHLPATTKDGKTIFVEGNAGNEKEAVSAAQNGADGLGLVRTEFLFFQNSTPPSQAQQQNLYQNIISALNGKPVTLRTLDIGGDKPVPYMPIPKEENPIMGLRGIRNYKEHRDLFLSQVRAMLQVSPASAVRIMLPMVAFVDELLEYKELIEQEKAKIPSAKDVKLGIMIEVPSAALLVEQLAPHADFFSIGTNDLTQYTLAIDRGHKSLCAHSDPLHPAILKLISLTCQGAARYQKPVAVCGAAAADPQAAALFTGLGVTELAVGASHIASIKALIRSLDTQQCSALAQEALALPNAEQVRNLVKRVLGI